MTMARALWPRVCARPRPLEDQGASASLGRMHLARALVTGGHASIHAEAFERLSGNGRPFHIEAERPSPQESIALVRAAGGVPVMAHPAISHAQDLIEPLVGDGLAGIEVYHGEHTPAQREELGRTAERLGLLATGGTDYHGPDGPSGEMGSSPMPDDVLDKLLAAADR